MEERTKIREERILEYYKNNLPIFKVLSIFNHYFGEDRVELEESFIEKLKEDIHYYFTQRISYLLSDIFPIEIKDKDIETLEDNEFDKIFEDYVLVIYNSRLISMPSTNIIIHYPEVTITNEYDESHLIRDLFAIIPIKITGRIVNNNFYLTRSTYTKEELNSNYLHSHISGIAYTDSSYKTMGFSPCLGDGPINNTLSSLHGEYNENLYHLFCIELDKYIQTESVAGGPYHRLSTISGVVNKIKEFVGGIVPEIHSGWISLFIDYILRNNKLKYSYIDNFYKPAYSFSRFNLIISNLFIEWINFYKYDYIPDAGINPADLLTEFHVNEDYIGVITYEEGNNIDLVGKPVIKFKGKKYNIKLHEEDKEERVLSKLLDLRITGKIYTNLIIAINSNE